MVFYFSQPGYAVYLGGSDLGFLLILLQGKRGKFSFYSLMGPNAFQTCGLWALAIYSSLLRKPGKVIKKCKAVASKPKLWIATAQVEIFLRDFILEKC